MPNSSFAFPGSDHATFSKDFDLCHLLTAECHYESTGVGVGFFFTLETGRTYELVKIKNSEPQA